MRTERADRVRYAWLTYAVVMSTSFGHYALLEAGEGWLYASSVSIGIALLVRALASFGRLGQAAVARLADQLAGRAPSLSRSTEVVMIAGALGVLVLMAWLQDDMANILSRLFFVFPLTAWSMWDYAAAHIRLTRNH